MSRSAVIEEEVTLVDLLDRILDTGVVIRGDITISVADVDLVYLQANVLLTSIAKMLSISEEEHDE
jgi:gas vesicle structural protein